MDEKNIAVSNTKLNECNREELLIICQALMKQLEETNQRMDNMLEQIRLAQHHRFGSSSEKNKLAEGYEQISMFFN